VFPAFALVLFSLFRDTGPGVRWTLYPPLSGFTHGTRLDFLIFGLHVRGSRSIIGSINMSTTIWGLRNESMLLSRISIFVWGVGVTLFLLLLSVPVLAGALSILIMDRHFNSSFFDYSAGGNPILYQHLF